MDPRPNHFPISIPSRGEVKSRKIRAEEEGTMRKQWLAVAALALWAGCSRAPMDVVGEVGRTIGAEGVRTIQYSGNGTIFILGQSVSPDAPWPRFTLTSYTALVDYEHGALREENVRTQYEDPPRGG